MTNTLCTYGEDQAPGAGCIKTTGHNGPHMLLDDSIGDYCPAEYPDPDGLGYVGHLCDRRTGHPNEHTVTVRTSGHERTLRWSSTT